MIPNILIVVMAWLSPEVTAPIYIPDANLLGAATLICPLSAAHLEASASLCGAYTKFFCTSPRRVGKVAKSQDQTTNVTVFACGDRL